MREAIWFNIHFAVISEKDNLIELARAVKAVSGAFIYRIRAGAICGITDAVEVIAYFNYITRVADGLGVDPEDWMS
jgi:hypothetical protein